jgi:hypothetical protein
MSAAERNAEQLAKAQAAFADCADAGMQPILECNGFPHHGQLAEFDVTLNPNELTGLLHEDIVQAVAIAEKHGGRLWLGPPDGRLSIVWPFPETPAGPGDGDGQKSPTQVAKEAAHTTEKD